MRSVHLLLLVAVAFAASSVQAQEPPRAKIIADAVFVEVGDTLLECGAVYGAIAACSANRNDTVDLRKRYSQASENAISQAMIFYVRGGISEAAISAKSKMFAKSVSGKLEGTCSNVSVLFEPLEACTWKQKNSDAWINKLAAEVDARTPRR